MTLNLEEGMLFDQEADEKKDDGHLKNYALGMKRLGMNYGIPFISYSIR